MSNNLNAATFIIAAFCAGIMAAAVIVGMPYIQPTLVSTAASIDSIISSDGQWASDAVINWIVPILPIFLPITTFLTVLYRMSTGRRPI